MKINYNELNFDKNNYEGWLCWAGKDSKVTPIDIYIGSCLGVANEEIFTK